MRGQAREQVSSSSSSSSGNHTGARCEQLDQGAQCAAAMAAAAAATVAAACCGVACNDVPVVLGEHLPGEMTILAVTPS